MENLGKQWKKQSLLSVLDENIYKIHLYTKTNKQRIEVLMI